jgi:phosphopantetheinyl transferase (holo-ACP synthase)
MCFIGNDIISLTDKSNIKSFSNYKYIQKILTERECVFFKQYQNLNFIPYLFWTCKESAYKIAVKAGINKCFLPHQFEVGLSTDFNRENVCSFKGSVIYEKNIYYFQSEIYSEYINTTACTDDNYLPNIQNYVGKCSDADLSLKIREHLRSRMAEHYEKDVEQFEILKTTKGIPYVSSFLNFTMPDISLSHDEIFFSYAILFHH